MRGGVRKLVALPVDMLEDIERLRARGIDDDRFGGPARSEAAALQRLVILGLEHRDRQAATEAERPAVEQLRAMTDVYG